MNLNIDYKTIPDLVDKEILSQDIKYINNNKIIKTIYLNENKQKVTLTQTLVKKAVLERKKWKKFGKAKISNDGITSIGSEVQIEYINNKKNFINYPIPNIPLKIKKKKNTKKYTPLMQKFRYKSNNKKILYNEFVVCIKNMPLDITSNELRDIANKYGDTTRAHVLNNKGIGFIHYNNKDSQELAIKQLHRSNIFGGHMLIHAEKANNNKS